MTAYLPGQSYRVPGILLEVGGQSAWWPVLTTTPHRDSVYIQSKGRHFHFDVRFLPDSLFPLRLGPESKVDTPQEMMCKIKTVYGKAPEVTWQEAICYREMPDFPSHLAPWSRALAEGYRECTLRPGLVCPHQGISLDGLPSDADGNVVCPGHGLRWNLRTGRMAA